MKKSFDFKGMSAYEFSALSKKNPTAISKVTVLDCKHCNDPAPREDIAIVARKIAV